jgi:hypothetical protein
VTPLRNNRDIARHAIWSMRGCETVAMGKIRSGSGPGHCETALEAATIRRTDDRGHTAPTATEPAHCDWWGHSGGRAIGHTDLGCARSGEGPAWTRRASSSQTLGPEYRHRVPGAQAVRPHPAQIVSCPHPPGHAEPLGLRPRLSG